MDLGKYWLIFCYWRRAVSARIRGTRTRPHLHIVPNNMEFDKQKDNTHRKYKMRSKITEEKKKRYGTNAEQCANDWNEYCASRLKRKDSKTKKKTRKKFIFTGIPMYPVLFSFFLSIGTAFVSLLLPPTQVTMNGFKSEFKRKIIVVHFFRILNILLVAKKKKKNCQKINTPHIQSMIQSKSVGHCVFFYSFALLHSGLFKCLLDLILSPPII